MPLPVPTSRTISLFFMAARLTIDFAIKSDVRKCCPSECLLFSDKEIHPSFTSDLFDDSLCNLFCRFLESHSSLQVLEIRKFSFFSLFKHCLHVGFSNTWNQF